MDTIPPEYNPTSLPETALRLRDALFLLREAYEFARQAGEAPWELRLIDLARPEDSWAGMVYGTTWPAAAPSASLD